MALTGGVPSPYSPLPQAPNLVRIRGESMFSLDAGTVPVMVVLGVLLLFGVWFVYRLISKK